MHPTPAGNGHRLADWVENPERIRMTSTHAVLGSPATPQAHARQLAGSLARCRAWGAAPLLAAATLSASPAGAAAPCDFTSEGRTTFSSEEVLECYDSVPFSIGTLENITTVLTQFRSLSDLAEIYQERMGWREHLLDVLEAGYSGELPSDFAMHEALTADHKRFRTPHVSYFPPGCYWRMLHGFLPFEFGSTVRRRHGRTEQIVFIEGAPYLPDVYREATGVDAESYVGFRVVAINGVPVLDYFREYGNTSMSDHVDDGGHLNSILNRGSYSLRLGLADFFPDGPLDEWIVENRGGRRMRLSLPWVYVTAEHLMGDYALPLSSSREEFVTLCEARFPMSNETNLGSALAGALRAPDADHHRRRALDECRRRGGHRGHRPPDARGYYEVPPEQLNQGVEEIIPLTGSAQVLEYDGRVAVLRVLDTRGWVDVAREGIAYACENSEALLIDARGNAGGDDTVIEWLYQHLFPEVQTLREAGKLVLRLRNDRPMLNEFLFNSGLWDAVAVPFGASPCELGVGPGCILDVETGEPLAISDLDWFREPSVREVRGGGIVSLSREFSLPFEEGVSFDGASCAGRFEGKNLIFLTDGTNGSGGYFLPAAFKGRGVIVTAGGYLGEDLAMGRATGGPTLPASLISVGSELMEQRSRGVIQFRRQLPLFEREVESHFEFAGAYHRDRDELHLEEAVPQDVTINVWSNSPETDGYVYGRVLEAVGSAPE